MKNNVSIAEERLFITKEFAAAIGGKVPSPYLRLHDPVQKTLADFAASLRGQPLYRTAYLDRMIHFWRDVSLAGLPCSGRHLDECYALLFESAFDLAEAEPEWAAATFAEADSSNHRFNALKQLNHQLCRPPLTHESLIDAYKRCYAPLREEDGRWQDAAHVAAAGEAWFWAAITCVAGIDEKHPGWEFRCDLAGASSNGWRDNGRLNLRLIREAPRLAQITPRSELMAHPMLRMARLLNREGSVEQKLVLRFFNARCIAQGFESEDDCFTSDLILAQWVRDARSWAERLLRTEPQVCAALFDTYGKDGLEGVRAFYRKHLGERPEEFDDLDATAALTRWAKRRRGYECSRYRGEVWEFAVEIANAALWLGWVFPRKSKPKARTRLSASGNAV